MNINIILNYLTNNFSPVSLSISSIAICSLIIFLLALKHNEINEKLAKKGNKIKIFAVNMIMLSITIMLLVSFFKISKYFMQTIDVEIYRLSIFHIIISLLILVLFNMHWNFVVDQVIKKVETKKSIDIRKNSDLSITINSKLSE